MISETANASDALRRLLPPGWQVDRRPSARGRASPITRLLGPGGQVARLLCMPRSRVTARDVPNLRERWHDSGPATADALLVVAPWLSVQTREVLARAGLSYVDAAGSLHLDVRDPAIFIHLDGAARDPAPPLHGLRSLRGRGSGRALRALLDFAWPVDRTGIRELAAASGASAATLSRVVGLLEDDDLVGLDDKRTIERIDRSATIRRWARDYPPRGSDAAMFLEPRGFDALERKLLATRARYVCTGGWGLSRRDVGLVAPPRVATLWVDEPGQFAEELALTLAERGGNVLLRRAWDDVVFDREWSGVSQSESTIRVAAAAQVAVDLLTGPGRDPAQGEALLAWMEHDFARWTQPLPGPAE